MCIGGAGTGTGRGQTELIKWWLLVGLVVVSVTPMIHILAGLLALDRPIVLALVASFWCPWAGFLQVALVWPLGTSQL